MVFSQPSGFTKFSENGVSNFRALTHFSHDGAMTSGSALTSGERDSNAFAAVDPSGGTVAVISYKSVPGYINDMERFDKTGAVQFYTGLDDAEHKTVTGVAVNIAGHALVFAQGDPFGQYARWYDGAGAAMTPWFLLLTPGSTAFLPDGKLVLYDHAGAAQYVLRDGQQNTEPLPDWLQARATNKLYVVRGGRAYATWGSGGQCGGALEILAISGKSCGCASVPEFYFYSSVGRDGSLIVPAARTPAPRCGYALYPQLLK